MKTKTKIIIGLVCWFLFIIIAILIAIYLILIANGYKVNFQTWKFEKTGLIYLKSQPQDVNIFINNQEVAQKAPYKQTELFSGRYDVKVSKQNYYDWGTTFNVEPGMASSDEYIRLFLVQPENLMPTTDEVNNIQKLSDDWSNKGLTIKNNNEIWFNDVLVTRFSEPVKQIKWYPDMKHIMFQVGKQIRIIEIDGSNNTKLVDLSSDNQSSFLPLSNGKELLYKDGDTVKKVKIE